MQTVSDLELKFKKGDIIWSIKYVKSKNSVIFLCRFNCQGGKYESMYTYLTLLKSIILNSVITYDRRLIYDL